MKKIVKKRRLKIKRMKSSRKKAAVVLAVLQVLTVFCVGILTYAGEGEEVRVGTDIQEGSEPEEPNEENAEPENPEPENPEEEDSEPEDTVPPEKVSFTYSRSVDGDMLFSNEPVELQMKSEDEQSQVRAICYSTSTGESGELEGAEGMLILEPGFFGTIEAYAVDEAGNQSEPAVSKTILCEDIMPEIVILSDGDDDGWNKGAVHMTVTVSDPELTSGLQNLRCYVNHSVVAERTAEAQGEAVTTMEVEFTVEQASENGWGIPVVVEVTDRAGNARTEERLVYIDMCSPQIAVEGIQNDMITSQPVKAQLLIADENFLGDWSLSIWRSGPESEARELFMERGQNQQNMVNGARNQSVRTGEIILDEDGYYEIAASATDMAGNIQTAGWTVTVDRTDPVIRYVEQMQGVYIPYFQWNYDVTEMISDFTKYSYQMTLNGSYYTAGTHVADEGTKLLQVKAVDAAGNEALAEAVFCIDHTPPEIFWGDLIDRKSYAESVELNVSVGGRGERLEEIRINSETLRLDEQSQIFRQTLNEPGEYTIFASAVDLAGNRAEKQMTFVLEESKTLVGKAMEPIRKLWNRDGDEARKEEMTEKEKTADILWLPYVMLGILVIGGGLQLLLMWGRRRRPGEESVT